MTVTATTYLNTMKLRGNRCPNDTRDSTMLTALPTRAIMRLEPAGATRRLRCDFGQVWVTLEGSSKDLILKAGDWVELPVRRLVVAEALVDSAVEILPRA